MLSCALQFLMRLYGSSGPPSSALKEGISRVRRLAEPETVLGAEEVEGQPFPVKEAVMRRGAAGARGVRGVAVARAARAASRWMGPMFGDGDVSEDERDIECWSGCCSVWRPRCSVLFENRVRDGS